MTKEFEGRSTDARDAYLTVTTHRGDGDWLRMQTTTTGQFNRPFYLRREDAPALALELLQLAGPQTDSTSLRNATENLQAVLDTMGESKKLDEEASVFFKAAYPDVVWGGVSPGVQDKFRRVAEAARAMHTNG